LQRAGKTNKQMINLCSTTTQAAKENNPCIIDAREHVKHGLHELVKEKSKINIYPHVQHVKQQNSRKKIRNNTR